MTHTQKTVSPASTDQVFELLKARKHVVDPSQVQILSSKDHCLALTASFGGDQPVDLLDSRMKVDESTMSAGFVISTLQRDRHGDVLIPAGCLKTIASYANYPVVFFGHNKDAPPIASASFANELKLWVEDSYIVSRGYFHGQTRESTEIFDLVARGLLRGASVGFIPRVAEIIGAHPACLSDETRPGDEVVFDFGGFLFKEWSLVEWSVTPMPSNPGALRSHIENDRIKSEYLKKALKPMMSPKAVTLFLDGSWRRSLVDDLVAPPQQGGGVPLSEQLKPKEYEVSGKPVKEKLEPQSVLFNAHRFPGEGEVKEWLDGNGLSGYELHLLDPKDFKQGEPPYHVVTLFNKDHCSPESVESVTVEEGVILYQCERKDKSTVSDTPTASDAVAQVIDSKSVSLDDRVATPVSHPVKEGGTPTDPVQPKEADVPYGADVLKQVCCSMDSLYEFLGSALKKVEQPKVLKFLERLHEKLMASCSELMEVGSAVYPDLFEPAKAAVEQNIQERSIVPTEQREYTHEDARLLSELLTELSANTGLSASQKVACGHFSKSFDLDSLVKLRKQVESAPAPQAAAPVVVPVVEPVVKSDPPVQDKKDAGESPEVIAKFNRISEMLYALTGQKV